MKKINLIKYVLVTMSSCLLMTSCYKDNGNYDYRELDGINVDTISKNITVLQFDTLKISPAVKQENSDGNNLKYEWLYALAGVNGAENVIRPFADTKNLVKQISFKPGKYDIIFRVTDTKTGVTNSQLFTLSVNNSLSEGWLVMSDVQGATKVDIITSKDKIYADLYAVNKQPLQGSPKQVSVVTTRDQAIYLLTSSAGANVSKLDFTNLESYSSWFYEEQTLLKPELHAGDVSGYAEFLINNGRLHYKNLFVPGIKKFGNQFTGDYQLAPVAALSRSGDSYFYDEKNGSFKLVKMYGTEFSPMRSAVAGEPFDFNIIKKKMIWWGLSTGMIYNAILKDDATGDFYLYQMDLGYSGAKALIMQKIENSAALKNAVSFDGSRNLALIYYVSGNKVYLYDIKANQSRELYAFSDGNVEATCARIYHNASDGANYEKILMVAINRNGNGSIFKFRLLPTGDFENNTYINKYDSFGKVVDMAYKVNK